MTLINPRSSWDPQYSDGDITLTGLADEVFVHHTVSVQLSPFATVEEEKEQMRALEATGQERFGTGISYNILIFPSGRAYQGVSFNRRGTHTDGRNSTTRSICFAGNYEENRPTDVQIATARAIYHAGKGIWWHANAPLYGHRDLKATACPGRHVYAELDTIRTPPPLEGPLMALNDEQQEELLKKVRELHSSLAGLQVEIPWEPGKKYSIRSAIAWLVRVIWEGK